MKTARKVLLLVLCAALLVSATVMGTIAYLSDSEAVVNTFTVGNVNIDINETDIDKDNDTKANKYEGLIPGMTIDKDPTVTVDANSDDCYLFVKVENGLSAIEIKEGETIAAQMAANGWQLVQDNVYIYTVDGEKAIVAAGASKPVFKTFTLDGAIDETELAIANNAEIKVTAYAIQTVGFESSTAAQIWEALQAELAD